MATKARPSKFKKAEDATWSEIFGCDLDDDTRIISDAEIKADAAASADGFEYGSDDDTMKGYEADTETDDDAELPSRTELLTTVNCEEIMAGYDADNESDSEASDRAQPLATNEIASSNVDEHQERDDDSAAEQELMKQLEDLTIRDNKGRLAIYSREEAAKFLAKSTGKRQGFVIKSDFLKPRVFHYFTRVPAEIREQIYAIHLMTADPVYGCTKLNVLNGIYTPAICQTNRQLRAESLPQYLSTMCWCICANAPLPIGEFSISNAYDGHGMGFGLGHGNFPGNITIDDRLDWTVGQGFVADDIEDGVLANWCRSLERLGRVAENSVRQFRIVCYAHKLLRRKTHGSVVYLASRTDEPFEGFRRLNEHGIMVWDIDLGKAPRDKKMSLAQVNDPEGGWLDEVKAAQVVLDGLVDDLRQKRLLGELRAHDVKFMVQTFAKYVEEMGMDEETKELRAIRF